jgi:hypothetical protein
MKTNTTFSCLITVLFGLAGLTIYGLIKGNLQPLPEWVLTAPVLFWSIFYMMGRYFTYEWYGVLKECRSYIPIGWSKSENAIVLADISISGPKYASLCVLISALMSLILQREVFAVMTGIAALANLLCIIPLLPVDGSRLINLLFESVKILGAIILFALLCLVGVVSLFSNNLILWIIGMMIIFAMAKIVLGFEIGKRHPTNRLSKEKTKVYMWLYCSIFVLNFLIAAFTSEPLISYFIGLTKR